jgi:hypothetical protein
MAQHDEAWLSRYAWFTDLVIDLLDICQASCPAGEEAKRESRNIHAGRKPLQLTFRYVFNELSETGSRDS